VVSDVSFLAAGFSPGTSDPKPVTRGHLFTDPPPAEHPTPET